MRTFEYGRTEIKANSYAEADRKAEEMKLETLVSNQTMERVKSFIDQVFKLVDEDHENDERIEETIGERNIYLYLRPENGYPMYIHFSVCILDDDVDVLTEVQKAELLKYAEDVWGDDLIEETYEFFHK